MGSLFGKITVLLAAVGVIALLTGWFVALLWNSVDMLDAVSHLSWWDGTKLMVLCGLLFRGGGGSSS